MLLRDEAITEGVALGPPSLGCAIGAIANVVVVLPDGDDERYLLWRADVERLRDLCDEALR